MKDIKVIIATHKKYEMPSDEMYLPVHVGAEGKQDLGYTKDNKPVFAKELKVTGINRFFERRALKKLDKKNLFRRGEYYG